MQNGPDPPVIYNLVWSRPRNVLPPSSARLGPGAAPTTPAAEGAARRRLELCLRPVLGEPPHLSRAEVVQ